MSKDFDSPIEIGFCGSVPEPTLSIDHAKHIVRLRHKDVHVTKRSERKDFDKYPALAVFHCMGMKSRKGYSYQHLGKDTTEESAWIDAAIRILANPEFWLDDEMVVRACWPEAHMYGDGRVWNDGTAAIFLGKWWKASRQHESVQSFEQQYRPKDEMCSVQTSTSCPGGCGGWLNTGDTYCPSCRYAPNEQRIKQEGWCWEWFGNATHRVKCRRHEGHKGEHDTQEDSVTNNVSNYAGRKLERLCTCIRNW